MQVLRRLWLPPLPVAHDFIMTLPPLVYDTNIGERRGSRVSTGQRQLIALARALIRELGY